MQGKYIELCAGLYAVGLACIQNNVLWCIGFHN